MANIRVDLPGTIHNGQTITFKSPADCSQVTGLRVYYLDEGAQAFKEFQFADAHGNNVGSIDLFTTNVLVKVILDTELNRAYVQNAVTNAYLENQFAGKAPNKHTHNSDDVYKIGDTLSTVRNDLGDNWKLCDGSAVSSKECPELCGYLPMLELSNSGNFIAYGNGIWVKVGTNSDEDTQDTLYTSKDPIYIDFEYTKFGRTARCLVHYSNIWMIGDCWGNYDRPLIHYTTDPEGEWSYIRLSNDCQEHIVSIAYHNGTWVALAEPRSGGGLYAYISTDPLKATDWTTPEGVWSKVEIVPSGTSLSSSHIFCYEGTWVIMSSKSASEMWVLSTTDPVESWGADSWNKYTWSSTVTPNSMTCYNGNWIAVGSNIVFTTKTPTGAWDEKQLFTKASGSYPPGQLYDIAYNADSKEYLIAGGGDNRKPTVYKSMDLKTWDKLFVLENAVSYSDSTNSFEGIEYADGMWVVIGRGAYCSARFQLPNITPGYQYQSADFKADNLVKCYIKAK